MHQPGPSGSGEPNAKGRKENIENDQQVAVGDAVAVNQEQTADILKMDIDCFEETFDYLPVEDLISVGKTCKRMQQVAGYFFQHNYSEREVHISENGVRYFQYSVEHFAPFIQRIFIEDEHGLQYFSKWQSKFRRLKQIRIKDFKTTDTDCLRKISMSKLDVLSIADNDLCNNFNEINEQCTKLRHLKISRCTGELNWLNRKYPTLEQFGFYTRAFNSSDGIPTFLELNPNIRMFKVDAKFLWEQRHAMEAANIKLDDLSIIMQYDRIKSEFVSICDLLVKLYEHGFYKKLQVEMFAERYNQEMINRFASLNGLNKLSLFLCRSIVTFSALNNLEQLSVSESKFIADIDELPNTLINLKRIHFARGSIDSIMPFIRRSVEMQAISLYQPQSGVHFNENSGIIDLRALNRERALLNPEQLAGVQKITLYVSERVYLATKWAFGETDFGLVRLKRCAL